MSSAWLRLQLESGSVSILSTGMGISDFPGSLLLPDCTAVMNAGICGALKTGYRIGDIVRPSRVRDGGTGMCIDIPSGSDGDLTTVCKPILSQKAKLSIPGDVVDMECYPQASWARENSIPFYCVKVVSDTIDTMPFVSAHLASLKTVLPVLTESVEKVVKNLVGNSG